MNQDLEALDQLIDEAVNEEKGLAVRADELAIKDKEFAEYLAAKKHNDEKWIHIFVGGDLIYQRKMQVYIW